MATLFVLKLGSVDPEKNHANYSNLTLGIQRNASNDTKI